MNTQTRKSALKDDINILHVGRQEIYKGTHLIINAVENFSIYFLKLI